MKVSFNNGIKKFQQGGPMPPDAAGAPAEAPMEGGAPTGGAEGAPQEGGDPMMLIAQMAMQALQSQDCNAAMQVCQVFVQLLQQAQGGGEGAPDEAPAGQLGEPVYRRGGTLVRRIRK